MLYIIQMKHAHPSTVARVLHRQRLDIALYQAKLMAYAALCGLGLLDRPVAHRVMADIDRGLSSTGTMTVSFCDYTLTIEKLKTYKRKSRAKVRT